MTATLKRSFPSMGGEASIRLESAGVDLERLADRIQALLAEVEDVLTLYRDSELTALNRDGRPVVPASPLLGDLVRVARRAAAQTRGLADATLPVQVRHRPAEPADLAAALRAAPARRPARPAAGWRSRQPTVDRDGRVRRGAGTTIDPGGLAKGLAADLAAAQLPAGVDFAISCGGDLAVGDRAWEVGVTGAHTGEEVHRLRGRGGVATSGIHARLWQEEDGSFSHHLLDPSTGRPAWTGLVAVTAVGATALDAEILAKAALLAGPSGARRMLRARGGVLQHDDGSVEVLEGLPAARLSLAA